MRAVVYNGAGDADVINIREVPTPEPGSDDAQVAVAYVGLNRADILERKGQYPSPLGKGAVPGLEFSGVVSKIGGNVKNVKNGDRVCGLVPGGAHAGYLITEALTLVPVPDSVSLEAAAALPEAYMTAFDALFTRGLFSMGQSVLIHAVGSSVGLAAIALVKNAGGRSIGTSRTPAKLERAKPHGLDVAILLDDSWPDKVRAATNGRGVDVVLDFVGAPLLDLNVGAVAVGGRIVQIGTLGGYKASFALNALMAKRATLVGTMLRSRPLDERIALARAFTLQLGPLFARGALRAEIDRVVPFEQMAEAHRVMEANENFGKIVIEVSPAPLI
jgi:putative PIG3 family NAD(P)H quinone oxidoreductase